MTKDDPQTRPRTSVKGNAHAPTLPGIFYSQFLGPEIKSVLEPGSCQSDEEADDRQASPAASIEAMEQLDPVAPHGGVEVEKEVEVEVESHHVDSERPVLANQEQEQHTQTVVSPDVQPTLLSTRAADSQRINSTCSSSLPASPSSSSSSRVSEDSISTAQLQQRTQHVPSWKYQTEYSTAFQWQGRRHAPNKETPPLKSFLGGVIHLTTQPHVQSQLQSQQANASSSPRGSTTSLSENANVSHPSVCGVLKAHQLTIKNSTEFRDKYSWPEVTLRIQGNRKYATNASRSSCWVNGVKGFGLTTAGDYAAACVPSSASASKDDASASKPQGQGPTATATAPQSDPAGYVVCRSNSL